MRFALTAVLSALLRATTAHAAPGDLDPSFGVGGKVVTPFISPYGGWGQGIAVQPDGKLLLAGTSQYFGAFTLLRFDVDGSLDASFNGMGGVVMHFGTAYDEAHGVAVQSDGKIVVAGHTGSVRSFALARFHADGSLDTSFGGGTGKVITAIGDGTDYHESVAVQPDGKIIVAGSAKIGGNFDFALVRYQTDGRLDTSFGGTGKVITPIGSGDDRGYCMVLLRDGRIVVAGRSYNGSKWEFAAVRYLPDGGLDTTFGGTRKVTTPDGSYSGTCNSVAAQRDGKIVLAGSANDGSKNRVALVRYRADGSLDPDFGGGSGKIFTPIGSTADAQSMTLQYDGKIVVSGVSGNYTETYREDFAVARYLPDGRLDTSFNGTGKVVTEINGSDLAICMALQGDGKIVVAGAAGGYFALARYESGIMPPFAQWKLAFLGDANAPDNGNSDGDAFINLAEYGLALSPAEYSAGPAGGRFAYAEGERLRMIFTRDPARDDVTIEAEAADEMAGPWLTIASSVFGAATTGPGYFGGDGPGSGLKTVEVRDVVNLGDPAHPRRYLRLRVKR